MNFIFGSSGFAKEVDWLIYDFCIYKNNFSLETDFFVVEDNSNKIGTYINGKKIIAESEFFKIANGRDSNVFIAIGNPSLRFKIHETLKHSKVKLNFINIFHPSVIFDKRESKLKLGMGNIVCAGSILTTDIILGSFVHINLDCTIGHDVIIKDYVTISPGVHISGNVYIGNRVYIGTGANIIEKITICDDAIIGAGAVVVKDIVAPGTYVGVPVVKIK